MARLERMKALSEEVLAIRATIREHAPAFLAAGKPLAKAMERAAELEEELGRLVREETAARERVYEESFDGDGNETDATDAAGTAHDRWTAVEEALSESFPEDVDPDLVAGAVEAVRSAKRATFKAAELAIKAAGDFFAW